MKMKDKLKEFLQDGPKSVDEIAKHFEIRKGHATSVVSANNKLFIRIRTGIVDLRERHPEEDHDRPKIIPGKKTLPLHFEIFNLLAMEPLTNEELYKALPYEKKQAIRATISLKPEMFVRIRTGFIGRKGRDDHYKE